MSRPLDAALHDPETRLEYEHELLLGEVIETVAALARGHVSQRELADRLKLTEGRVSQILSGDENLTLRSLASLGWALGLRFQLHPVPMADRRGTPAEGDAALPSWLDDLHAVSPAQFDVLSPAKPVGRAPQPVAVVSGKDATAETNSMVPIAA
jgi:hypothetical protein